MKVELIAFIQNKRKECKWVKINLNQLIGKTAKEIMVMALNLLMHINFDDFNILVTKF